MTADQLDLLTIVVTLWPCLLILKRLGLKPAATGLLVFSLIIPLLGHMMLALYMACSRWPNYQAIAKPPKRVKL